MPDIKKTNLNKSISVKPQVFNTPLGVGDIGSSAKNAEKARIWAEGTDPEVETLGGEHSAKGWAEEAQKAVSGGGTWGSITGTLSDQTDLQTALNAKMDKAGGTFTGDVTLGSGVNLKTANGRLHEVNNKLVLGDGSNNGLYVNPNGQTAALINGGTVKNLITSYDVKSTYSSTGMDPVNGTAVASAISGIGITSNWYDNQSGATLSTGLTISDPSKVVVFKNGNLLRPGQIISAKHFTGGNNHSVALLNTAPISTADSWSVSFRMEWTPGNTSAAIMNAAGTTDYQVPVITHDSGTGRILFLISSTGSSWNITYGSSSTLHSPTDGTIFDLKLSFTGSKYEMLYSDDYGKNWTVGQADNSSTKTYCNSAFRFLYNKLSAGVDFNNSSTIYWEKTKIVINGTTWFDGATAVENTDYENDGCTVTNVTTATNDYAIDTATGTIYFADNLVNDTITVLH